MDSLKVLTEVVKTQSFTKAAENLYTSAALVKLCVLTTSVRTFNESIN
jgi:hypothetical protein